MEIIHVHIPPEIERWRSVEETLVAASAPFLSCAAPSFPRLLSASLLLLLSIAVSRAFLVLFITPVLVGFGLVWFASFRAFFTSSQRVFFLPFLFSFPNLLFVFWALVVEGLV
jgi:hypothetical protein